MLVGKVVGRTSPEWFSFEVSDVVKKMDFIAIRDPENHWVLGRIEGIIQEKEKAVAKVSVIGYVDKRGVVRRPKMPFKPGSYVYRADDELIKRVLGMKSSGLFIGLLDGSENLKVYLDPERIITKHLAVLARTGTGKSYFVSVILEELLENKIPAVVIDPHGEYTSIQYPNSRNEEIKYMSRFEIEPKGYKNDVEIFCLERNLSEGAKKLKFNEKLTHQEIFDMLPFRLSSSQLSVIYSVITEGKTSYTIDEIKKDVERSKSRTKWNVLPVLDYLKSSNLFDSSYVKPQELVKKGKLSIINLRGVEPEIQQLVVYKIAKDLFEARKSNKIPPFLFVVEESQNFSPERGFGEAISSRILRTIASEGRKFGMSLCVISQRPARVDKNVLSQCNTQVFLRINNPNDLKAISDSIEGITRGLESEIKTLPVGTGVVVGLIEHPLIVNIRIKRSNHAGTAFPLTEKFRKMEEADTLYFYPKFLEEDIRTKIKTGLEQFKLVYYPSWRLRCKFDTPDGEKIDSIFVDGLFGELMFLKDKKLMKTEGITKLVNLKLKERGVLLYLTTYGLSTFDNIEKELKIESKELGSILHKLKEMGLVSEKNEEYKSNLNVDFEEIIKHQIKENPTTRKHTGEKLPLKITRSSINKVLDIFNPDAVERKVCYYPLWFIFYENGNVDVIDGLTGEKDEHLIGEDVLDILGSEE